MKQQKLSFVIRDEIWKGVNIGMSEYLSIPQEKRHELEEQGININTFIYEKLVPIIEKTQVASILVINSEGIGNVVMMTPMLKILKQLHPLLKVTVWCKDPAAEVIRGWDAVDNVITEFDGNYYDMAFVSIWGGQTFNELKDIIHQHCKNILQVKFRSAHESLQHLSLSEFMGGDGTLTEAHCQEASGEELESLDKLKKEILKDQKYIVFGDTTLRNFGWDKKHYPYYTELAGIINKKYPEYKIAMIGDSEDKKEAEEKTWPDNVVLDFMGAINIPQLASLVKDAEIYVGNDTGPTHIAAAMGTKTYAIFGPTLISKNRPIGKDVHIITKRLPCSPCQYTDRWESCDETVCYPSAQDVYEEIFHSGKKKRKPKTILVGDFSGGALRNETYIKHTLEKDFGHKVIPFDYRTFLKKAQAPPDATYELLNSILHNEPDHVLICGGQQLEPAILKFIEAFVPKTKVYNWYVDNRGQVEQWFYDLSSVCDKSYWSTGDPLLLSQVFSKLQRPCEFLPIVPDDKSYYPEDIEKDIDVLFVGTPHSKPRIDLLEYLVDNGVNVQMYGNGEWPEKLKQQAHKGVFGKEFNTLLNRAKIVINTNIINDVPLYFSDRYFYPMAVKTVGINQYIPNLEDMFQYGKHMFWFKSHEECKDLIEKTLTHYSTVGKDIQEEGYKLYKEKYTLKEILGSMF